MTTTFNKRQKEAARKERQADKHKRRDERRIKRNLPPSATTAAEPELEGEGGEVSDALAGDRERDYVATPEITDVVQASKAAET